MQRCLRPLFSIRDANIAHHLPPSCTTHTLTARFVARQICNEARSSGGHATRGLCAELTKKGRGGGEYYQQGPHGAYTHDSGQRAPPRPAPSRGSIGLAGMFTRPVGLPHPWGAISCRKEAPLTYHYGGGGNVLTYYGAAV